MYIAICEIDRQVGLMQETGCTGPLHWDDSEGWDGEQMYIYG